jgi:hypothetical protein
MKLRILTFAVLVQSVPVALWSESIRPANVITVILPDGRPVGMTYNQPVCTVADGGEVALELQIHTDATLSLISLLAQPLGEGLQWQFANQGLPPDSHVRQDPGRSTISFQPTIEAERLVLNLVLEAQNSDDVAAQNIFISITDSTGLSANVDAIWIVPDAADCPAN